MHGAAELTHLQLLRGQNSSSREFRAKKDGSDEKLGRNAIGRGLHTLHKLMLEVGNTKFMSKTGREALNPPRTRSNKNNKMLS